MLGTAAEIPHNELMTNRAGGLTADEFVEKWSKARLSERSASQEHFIDLCHLLNQPTPGTDSTGEDYCFEKYVKVVGAASKGSKGDGGFVDVWKRGCFAWEYKGKGKHKSLDEAYRQLYQYRDDLNNPPLSIVCDIRTTEIRAHFPGYPTEKTVVQLEEIPGRLEVLRRVFTNPLSFKPQKTREDITTDLAKEFGDLADKILSRSAGVAQTLWQGHGDPVAHFLMKVMFCLFAEDVGLLPKNLFSNLVERCLFEPEEFRPSCEELFEKMRKGGRFGNDKIEYFNGGLFDDAPPLALTAAEMNILHRAAARPWQAVEPSIFGTLFERILDPKKRAQIGAHYTSKSDILLVIDPVIMTPLRRRWSALQEELAPQLAIVAAEKDAKKRDVLSAPVRIQFDHLRRHLESQRILDPACGSGNFLYVALQRLLDLDDEIVRFAARYDIALNPFPFVRPTQLHGIEINPYAAEMAQVVIWIGYLQWLAEHHIDNPKRPILDKLVTIENRDAILDLSKPNLPVPAQWPEADYVVGNPPFLGGSMIWQALGSEYRDALWAAFEIPNFSDLCCYWFEIAKQRVSGRPVTRCGLLATQAIRFGANRAVLDGIATVGNIFNTWSDKEWLLEGAMVHVAIVCFDGGFENARELNGQTADKINSNLSLGIDTGDASELTENLNLCLIGVKKAGPFDMELNAARELLAEVGNPNGKTNAGVLRPVINGVGVTRRDPGNWIIDFGENNKLTAASEFAAPFRHVQQYVKPERAKNKRELYRKRWWLYAETRPTMRSAQSRFLRCLATPYVTKHRLFSWLASATAPADGLFIFARDDDYFFGVMHSAIHELWTRKTGSQLREAESGFRYTPSTTFETFPLPWSPGKEDTKHPAYFRISEAAKKLNEQRERWLNPPEWIDLLSARIDAVDTFEDVPKEARSLVRQSAIMAAAAKDPRLKKRTLTNLYNERPTWLKLAHEQLDRAVLAAYAAIDPQGDWSEDWAGVWTDSGAGQPLPVEHPLRQKRAEIDQRVLANLLRLNHARAGVDTTAVSSKTKAAAAPHEHRPLNDPKLALALAEYRDGLRQLYHPEKLPRIERVVLFGSRARGNASAGSDADVLVVLHGPFNPDKELERTSKLTAEVSLKHRVAINRMFMNKKQADSRAGLLQGNISLDGLIL